MRRAEAIGWTAEAYEWRELGCLQYDSLPVFARRCVTAFGRGIARKRHLDFEKREKERESKSKSIERGRR